MGAKKVEIEWGKVQGSITLPGALPALAYQAGKSAYRQAEAEQFCGDEVTWLPDADWHAECAEYFPRDVVRELGFEPSDRGTFRVYSTHGTDPHIDGEGPAFVLVLANDGLKFKQGKHTHLTEVGQWYIFDDRKTHTVNAGKRSTAYVFLHVPLRGLA